MLKKLHKLDTDLVRAETLRLAGAAKKAIKESFRFLGNHKSTNISKINAWLIISKSHHQLGELDYEKYILDYCICLCINYNEEYWEIRTKLAKSFWYLQQLELQNATKLIKECSERSIQQKREDLQADILAIQAHLEEDKGNYKQALEQMKVAYKKAKSSAYVERQITTISDIGRILGIIGEYDDAILHLEKALKLTEENKLVAHTSTNLTRLSFVYFAMGDKSRGFNLATKALSLSEAHHLVENQLNTLHRMGVEHLRWKEYEAAEKHLEEALSIAASANFHRNYQFIGRDYARLLREVGQEERADELLKKIWRQIQNRDFVDFAIIPSLIDDFIQAFYFDETVIESLENLKKAVIEIKKNVGTYEYVQKDRAKEKVLQKLKKELNQLDEYLGDDINKYLREQTQSEITAEVARRSKTRIFIAYAREDQAIAFKIFNYFKGIGYKVWIDQESLLCGERWERVVKIQIEEAHFVVVLLSNNSIKKNGYIQAEIKHALNVVERISPSEIFLLPLKLDDCDIPYEFKPYHYLPFPEVNKQGLTKIESAIKTKNISA